MRQPCLSGNGFPDVTLRGCTPHEAYGEVLLLCKRYLKSSRLAVCTLSCLEDAIHICDHTLPDHTKMAYLYSQNNFGVLVISDGTQCPPLVRLCSRCCICVSVSPTAGLEGSLTPGGGTQSSLIMSRQLWPAPISRPSYQSLGICLAPRTP